MENTTGIQEINLLPFSEGCFRRWERLEDMYITRPVNPSSQWADVLKAKWALAMWAQKGGN